MAPRAAIAIATTTSIWLAGFFLGDLERLRTVSESLSRQFAWMEGQATLFVLTNMIPLVSFMRCGYRLNLRLPVASRIQLTIDPIVSPRQVAAEYEHMRGGLVNTRYRNVSERHLHLAIFVAERPDGEIWAKGMGRWNKQWKKRKPKWIYEQVTNFGRDCNRAVERLVRPPISVFPRNFA